MALGSRKAAAAQPQEDPLVAEILRSARGERELVTTQQPTGLAPGEPGPPLPPDPTRTAEPQGPARWSDIPGGKLLSREWRERANARLAEPKGVGENLRAPIPFRETGRAVYDLLHMRQLEEKIRSDKATKEEVESYYDFVIDEGVRRNSFWGGVTDIGLGAVEFGGEFALTSMAMGAGAGASAAARTGARAGVGAMTRSMLAGAAGGAKAAARGANVFAAAEAGGMASLGLREVADNASRSFMTKVVGEAVRIGSTLGAQEVVPQMVGAPGGAWTLQTLQQALPGIEFTEEESARVVDDMNAVLAIAYENGADWKRGLALQAMEVGSESMGGLLNKLKPVQAVNAVYAGALRRLAGRSTKTEFLDAISKAARFDGPFSEVLEEYVAEIGKIAAGSGKTFFEALGDVSATLPEMTVAFSLPGVGRATAQRVTDSLTLARGGQVEGRDGVGDATGSAASGSVLGAAGESASSSAAPPLPSFEARDRAIENYGRSYQETFGEERGDLEVVSPQTAAQSLAARVMERAGVQYAFVRGKGESRTNGFYDQDSGVVVIEADSPAAVRTAYHEVAHHMWARMTPQQQSEFTAALESVDPEFLTEMRAQWEGDLEVDPASVSDELGVNEAQATGAEEIAPAMEFLSTPRGAELLRLSGGAKEGRAARLYDFAKDFLRAMAGMTPKAPTTALRAFEKTLGAERGTGAQIGKIATAYEKAWEEAKKNVVGAPATPASYAGMDTLAPFDPGGVGIMMGLGADERMQDRPLPGPRKPRRARLPKDRGGKRAAAAEKATKQAKADAARAAARAEGRDLAGEVMGKTKAPAPGRARVVFGDLVGTGRTPLFQPAKRKIGTTRKLGDTEYWEEEFESGAQKFGISHRLENDRGVATHNVSFMLKAKTPDGRTEKVFSKTSSSGSPPQVFSTVADSIIDAATDESIKEYTLRFSGADEGGRLKLYQKLLQRMADRFGADVSAEKFINGDGADFEAYFDEGALAKLRALDSGDTVVFSSIPKEMPPVQDAPLFQRASRVEQMKDGRWAAIVRGKRYVRVNKGAAERTLDVLTSRAKIEPLFDDEIKKIVAEADVHPVVKRGERKRVKPKSVKISEASASMIASAGENAKLVEDAWRKYAANYPPSDGWAPIELKSFTIDAKGNVKLGVKGIPFGFGKDEETGRLHSASKEDERRKHITRLGSRIAREVRKVTARAKAGDDNAVVILRNAAWYTQMVDVLRNVFGGSADLFVDVLGATSPNTPVPTNWNFALDFVRGFSQGRFDEAIEKLSQHLAEGRGLSEFPKLYPDLVPRQENGKMYGINSMNALSAALQGVWRSREAGTAPKARNFSWNFTTFSDDATIDVWAARFIARMDGKDRIPPEANTGVSGSWNSQAAYITGEFGFAQEAMQVAADLLDMRAKDLQAVLWFVEKELWTEKAWTSKIGEGGSAEAMESRDQLARYTVGLSIQKSSALQGESFIPSREDQERALSGMMSALNANPDVVSSRLASTIGRYVSEEGEAREKSFDIEVVARPGFDVAVLEREVKRIAKQYKQDGAFMSRVMRHDEDIDGTERPGLEVYFTRPLTMREIEPMVATIRARGIDGFTFVRSMQPKASRGEILDDPEVFTGLRLQAIHEFYTPDQFMKDGERDLAAFHDDWEERAFELHDDLGSMEDVAYVGHQSLQTVVFFGDSYDESSGQASRSALARRGKARAGVGRGEGSSGADSRGGARNGGSEAADGDVRGGDDGATFARRRGGRYRLKFRDELGLNETAAGLAGAFAGRRRLVAPTGPQTRGAAPAVERDPKLGMSPETLEAAEGAALRAGAEGDRTKIGRAGLNNPANTIAGRTVVRAADEERAASMGVHAREDALREATANLAKPGRRRELELKLAAGEQLSDTETLEAVIVQEELAKAWVDSNGARSSFRDAVLWAQALRATRTEQARALGVTAGRGLSAETTWAESVFAPTRNQERRLRRIRKRMAAVVRDQKIPGTRVTQLGGIFSPRKQQELKEARRRVTIDSFDRERGRMVSPAVWSNLVAEEQRILDEIQAATQRGIDAVQAAGYTVADMQRLWMDPLRGRKIRAVFGAAKATLSDKAFEFRYASILSGVMTHVRNISGNAANFVVEGILQPTFEGLVNTAAGDPASARADEGIIFAKGAKRAFSQAVQNAWTAWRSEMPVLELEMAKGGANIGAYRRRADAYEADQIAPAMDNAVANVLRKFSLSALLAVDEFFKTMAVGGQSLALATRIARNQGLSGAALDSRVQALLADAQHPLWAEAVEKARKIAFQDEGGAGSRAAANAAFGFRSWLDTATPYLFLGTTLLPFVGTPVRIFANVLRRSPLQASLLVARLLRGKYRKDPGLLITDLADAGIAALLTATVWSLMGDDEDELPRLTGSKPTDPGEREHMRRLGIPEMSVRVGDRWYSYRDIEPLSTSLGVMADAIAEARRTGTAGAMQAAFSSAVKIGGDKTFMRTLGDLHELVTDDRNRGGRVAELATYSFITPWVPNLIRQPLRATDELRRQYTRKQDGESIFTTAAKALPYQLLPIEALAPAPMYDLWGRPMGKEAGTQPAPTIVRMLSPVIPQGRKGDQMAADLFLQSYKHAVERGEIADEKVSYPLAPSYTFAHQGRTYRWTEDEYAELTRRSGEIAAEAVASVVRSGALDPKRPTAEQFEMLKKLVANSRKSVVAELKQRRFAQEREVQASR